MIIVLEITHKNLKIILNDEIRKIKIMIILEVIQKKLIIVLEKKIVLIIKNLVEIKVNEISLIDYQLNNNKLLNSMNRQ
jgi:hypothetical protein